VPIAITVVCRKAMKEGFTAFVHEVSEQAHEDIKTAVEAGELPEGATESVSTHKFLVCAHVLNCLRSEIDDEGEINHDTVEMVAERHINAVIEA